MPSKLFRPPIWFCGADAGDESLFKHVRSVMRRMPRIVAISAPRARTLLDYKYDPVYHGTQMASEVKNAFGDHEVMLLLLWAVIAPAAGLAYLVWKKYPRLRVVALLLFVVSLFQFLWQWGGIYGLLKSFVGAR